MFTIPCGIHSDNLVIDCEEVTRPLVDERDGVVLAGETNSFALFNQKHRKKCFGALQRITKTGIVDAYHYLSTF